MRSGYEKGVAKEIANLVSMVTSSREDLPRGIEFLLSPNRLNVAISRAQWACFVLRSPHLAVMEPTSPEGMVMLGKFVTLCKGRESVSMGLYSE